MERARCVRDSDVRRTTGVTLLRPAEIARTHGTGNSHADCRPSRSAAGLDSPATALVHDVLGTPGSPLEPALRADMEQRFGHDFATVRIHAGARAARSAAAVASLAYTVGDHVVLGSAISPGAEGRRVLAHELVHTIQQRGTVPLGSGPVALSAPSDAGEAEAETLAQSALQMAVPRDERAEAGVEPARPTSRRNEQAVVGAVPSMRLQRAAIHSGTILDEGSCEHLACNSKWACPDASGVECPEGTRNAFKDKKTKYSPLFTCDIECDKKTEGCSDSAHWMAIPHSRFALGKCRQDLVICAGGRFTHAAVRDRSEREAWEVGHGVQDSLAVSPYATIKGAIYGDENDAAFKTDARCGNAKKAGKPDAGSGGAEAERPSGDAGTLNSDAGIGAAVREADQD